VCQPTIHRSTEDTEGNALPPKMRGQRESVWTRSNNRNIYHRF
jgi:hypothetical protein